MSDSSKTDEFYKKLKTRLEKTATWPSEYLYKFILKTDASKIALAYLVEWLRLNGFILLDTQWMTDHLRQFGGIEVPREEYLNLLAEALAEEGETD